MNFLSHHYFSSENTSPYFHLGKNLPDLVRQGKGRLKVGPNYQAPNEELEELHAGVLLHLKIDDIFHSSDFFKTETGKIKELIQNEGFIDFKKYHFFLAHISLELILDKILVDTKPNLCEHFYVELSKINEETIAPYLDQHLLNTTSKEFFHYFRRFTEARYLFHYRENESLSFALSRIIERTGLPELSFKDKKKLNSIVIQAEEGLKTNYSSIFELLKNELNL